MGPRPLIGMTLLDGATEKDVVVLLDAGSSVPVLSLDLAKELRLPLVERSSPRKLYSFSDTVESTRGFFHTGPLVLRHTDTHFTRLPFELATLGTECDIILPHWWLHQHQPQRM